MKPVKDYRYVKWPCQRLAAQLLLCKTALNGPAPCVPSPSSGLWGWRHPIYIFLIFPGHLEFWTPLQIPIWGPPLGCTLVPKVSSHPRGLCRRGAKTVLIFSRVCIWQLVFKCREKSFSWVGVSVGEQNKYLFPGIVRFSWEKPNKLLIQMRSHFFWVM